MDNLVIWQAGFVRGFNLKLFNEAIWHSVLGYYSGKEVEVCIREKKKKISAATHGYYRGVILPLCLSSEMFGGWLIDEVHDYFVSKYLCDVKEKLVNGNTVLIKTTRSTGEIGQKAMNAFIEQVRAELEANNITTPNPEKL